MGLIAKNKTIMKKKTEYPAPEVGMKIYIPSSFYLSHGLDDFQGGVATISEVVYSNHLPKNHFNYCFVGIKERERTRYNYFSLMSEQKKLEAEFGDKKCYPDPDYHPSANKWD